MATPRRVRSSLWGSDGAGALTEAQILTAEGSRSDPTIERWSDVVSDLEVSLSDLESPRTLRQEIAWCESALRQLPKARQQLSDARPLGEVLVTLPSSLPLYSALLFGVSASLPGNAVRLRPSRKNVEVTRLLVEQVFHPIGLDITIANQGWAEFAASTPSPDGVLFTGSYDHAVELERRLSPHAVFAYQGGGNCAAVVSPGADLERAVATIVRDRCFNSGQDCLSTERIYVHEDIMSDFIERLLQESALRTASPDRREEADLHPLEHADRFRSRRQRALRNAIRVLADGAELSEGLFGLTVVESTPRSADVVIESYGPLLHVVAWGDEEELRRMLLRGTLALGITFWGELPTFGTLDFGQVSIDESLYEYEDFLAPFGGYRRSSFVRRSTACTTGPFWVPDAMSADRGSA